MRNTIFTAMLLIMLIPGGIGLSGCNTVRGAGQDIEGAGEAVQDAAD